MKIFDCITYYDEEILFDLRCHELNSYVDYFVVVEAKFTHSGEKKKLNFDIQKYPKFKNKIIYFVIEDEPSDIITIDKNISKDLELSSIRKNSLKRIEQSYEACLEAIKGKFSENDYFMLSDSDEIPKINNSIFSLNQSKVILFKQDFYYYKFNLFYDLMPWYGTRACKFKNLISPTWLRNTKHKIYPFWRLDTLFNKNKLINIQIINNGGWHFSNLKMLENIITKLNNSGHKDEYMLNSNQHSLIKKMIENKEVYYDHFADKRKVNKIRKNGYKLKKVEIDKLPNYIKNNKTKLVKFLD